MAIAYVNKGTFTSGNGAITPPIPTGYTVGNLLLLLVESANETISTPSGWTLYEQTGTGTAATAGGVRLGIFWRIATSGQTAPTVADTGNHTAGIIFEFSGVEPGAPFAQKASSTASTSSFSFGSLTILYNQAFILYCIGNDRDAASTSNLSGWSSSLNNLTTRHDQTISTGVGGGLALATATSGSNAGASTGTTSATNAAAVNVILYTIEVRPKIPLASTISTATTKSADLKKLGLKSTVSSGSIPVLGTIYGFIYNWYAVADSRNIAPSGWHVPTSTEVLTLCTYLDPNAAFQSNIAAIKITEPVTYWIEGENVGTNTAKFNARGLDGRSQYGFNALGNLGCWWCSNEYNSTHGYYAYILRNDPELICSGFGLHIIKPKWTGLGLRLMKDSTMLSNGETGYMTGNDGKLYRTICIGTQEWLADNLCETKYRNGESIPGPIYTNEAWYGLTTSGHCIPSDDISKGYSGTIPNPYVLGNLKGTAKFLANINSCYYRSIAIKFGFLYNWYAATNSDSIANTGWHVPTKSEYETLLSYLGGGSNAMNALKETGTTYWVNTNGTNTSNFNGRAAGTRNDSGAFSNIKNVSWLWCTDLNGNYPYLLWLDHTNFNGISWTYKIYGCNIRLIKDSTTLSHGQTGTYTGNDGNVYRTICIGTQEWVADNLIETKYRSGAYISLITDQTAWTNLKTGAYCAYSNTELNAIIVTIIDSLAGLLKGKGLIFSTVATGNSFATGGYGFLYNCYVVRNTANIANTGWSIPTLAQWQALATYLGGESVAGGKLKETGYNHWTSPNTDATNEYNFYLRGASNRDPDTGNFSALKSGSYLWSSTAYMTNWGTAMGSAYNTAAFAYSGGGSALRTGFSIRLRKDSTSLSNGQTGTYTGNDGKTYPTICINGVEYLARNLAETKYRDGSSIPHVSESSSWNTLTTHGYCAHSNNIYNALADGTADGVYATIEFTGQAASLISTILSASGISVSLTGKCRLLSNVDGSTTLFAQIEGGSFIPVITFF